MQFPAYLESALALQEDCDRYPTHDPAAIFQAFWKQRRYGGSNDRRRVYTLWREALMYQARALFFRHQFSGTTLLKNPHSQDRSATHSLSPATSFQNRLALFLSLRTHYPVSSIKTWCQDPRGPTSLSTPEEAWLETYNPLVESPNMPTWVKAEIPELLYPLFQEGWGEKTLALGQALNQLAPVDLRVKPQRTSLETLFTTLNSHGLLCKRTPFSPWGLRLNPQTPLSRLPDDIQATFELQDEGSQLIGLCLTPQQNECILDLCAGVGGKTQVIAEHLPSSARLVASDIAPWRLKKAQERFNTSGLSGHVDFCLASSAWQKAHNKKFNKVLIDAPCSGTGVWRRHPLAKWSLTPRDIHAVQQIQLSLLHQAAALTCTGGLVFYATCSVLPHENEYICQQFLTLNPHIQPYPLPDIMRNIPNSMRQAEFHMHQLTPLIHGTDGFFIACFIITS